MPIGEIVMNENSKSFLGRVAIYLCVGLVVFIFISWQNHKKVEAPPVSPDHNVSIPEQNVESKSLPGFDARDLKEDKKDDGIVQSKVALAKLAKEPEEDMVPPTFYSDMDGEERDAIDSVYDQIWLDAEKRTGINYKQITIEDIYRIDSPTYDPTGMNSYEAYVLANKKCEIVSFSINYQNATQFNILGSRPCTTGKVDQSGE